MRKNILLFKLYYLFTGMWLFSALAVIYFKDICQSYTLAIFAYSLISLTTSVVEIPLGIVSDRWGRKFNLLLSSLFLFLNMLFWGYAGYNSDISLLFLGSIFRGIGIALHSGTDVAFLYEITSKLRQKKLFDKIYSQTMAYHQLGLLFSAIIGMIVTYYFPLSYLVWLSVVPAFLKIFIVLLMKEAKNSFDKRVTPYQQLKKSIHLLCSRKKLRSYIIMKILSSGVTLSVYRFEPLYFEQLIPLYLINIVRITTHATGYLGYMLVPVVNKISFLKLLFYSNIGMASIRAIGLIINNALTPFISAFGNITYGIGATSQVSILQKEYHNSLRATMASISELACGFSILIIGGIYGVIMDYTSPLIAIWVAVASQVIIAGAYNKLFNTYTK